MQLGGTNFGYLNAHGLEDTLDHLASTGLKVVELGLAPPHVDLESIDSARCREIRQRLGQFGLKCSSVNAAELNLISQNEGVSALAVRQYRRAIQVAAEIGAPVTVIVPGRQHPLRPMPPAIAIRRFRAALSPLQLEAERNNIVLALETVPFGFLETAKKLSDAIENIGDRLLRVVLDAANMLMVEDPAQGVADASGKIEICHVSDAWKKKWAHTSIGRGEVDFAGFKQALDRVGYQGVTIYELMDNDDPAPRMQGDIRKLEALGWELGQSAGRA